MLPCCQGPSPRIASPSCTTSYRIDMGLALWILLSRVGLSRKDCCRSVINATCNPKQSLAVRTTMLITWMESSHSSNATCQIKNSQWIPNSTSLWAKKGIALSDSTISRVTLSKCRGCTSQQLWILDKQKVFWHKGELWQWVELRDHRGGAEVLWKELIF